MKLRDLVAVMDSVAYVVYDSCGNCVNAGGRMLSIADLSKEVRKVDIEYHGNYVFQPPQYWTPKLRIILEG